jgi:hypothetical protein
VLCSGWLYVLTPRVRRVASQVWRKLYAACKLPASQLGGWRRQCNGRCVHSRHHVGLSCLTTATWASCQLSLVKSACLLPSPGPTANASVSLPVAWLWLPVATLRWQAPEHRRRRAQHIRHGNAPPCTAIRGVRHAGQTQRHSRLACSGQGVQQLFVAVAVAAVSATDSCCNTANGSACCKRTWRQPRQRSCPNSPVGAVRRCKPWLPPMRRAWGWRTPPPCSPTSQLWR